MKKRIVPQRFDVDSKGDFKNPFPEQMGLPGPLEKAKTYGLAVNRTTAGPGFFDMLKQLGHEPGKKSKK